MAAVREELGALLLHRGDLLAAVVVLNTQVRRAAQRHQAAQRPRVGFARVPGEQFPQGIEVLTREVEVFHERSVCLAQGWRKPLRPDLCVRSPRQPVDRKRRRWYKTAWPFAA